MKVYSDTTYLVIDKKAKKHSYVYTNQLVEDYRKFYPNGYFQADEWFGKRFFKLAYNITKQTDLYNNTMIHQIIDYKRNYLIIKK